MAAARKTAAAARVNWRLLVPDAADGVFWAVTIQRHVAPRDWVAAIASIPEAHRADAEAYLRTIAARMRVAKNTKAAIAAADGTF